MPALSRLEELIDPSIENISLIVRNAHRGRIDKVLSHNQIFTCETYINKTDIEIIYRINQFIFHSQVYFGQKLKIFRGGYGCVRFSLRPEKDMKNISALVTSKEYIRIARSYDIYRVYYKGTAY